MTNSITVAQSPALLPIDQQAPAQNALQPRQESIHSPNQNHSRLIEKRGNFFARIFKSDHSGTLVIGCGREGTKWNTADANKKHQHAKDGATTMDIEAENNPDFVADITSRNLLSAKMDNDLNKFKKIKFENISGAVVSAENCDAVVDNILALSGDKVKVSLTTGKDNDLNHLNSALKKKGFQVNELSEGRLKATKG